MSPYVHSVFLPPICQKIFAFIYWIAWVPLQENNEESISGLCVLFHLCVALFLLGFILALYWVLISRPPNLFFKICLHILGPRYFHMNFRICLSFAIKSNKHKNLIDIRIKTYQFGEGDILNILSHLIRESDISLHLFGSLSFLVTIFSRF